MPKRETGCASAMLDQSSPRNLQALSDANDLMDYLSFQHRISTLEPLEDTVLLGLLFIYLFIHRKRWEKKRVSQPHGCQLLTTS